MRYIIMLLACCSLVAAYQVSNSTIEGVVYNEYTINRSELPLDINISIPINKTNTTLYTSAGSYIYSTAFINLTNRSSQSLNITIHIPMLSVGVYDSFFRTTENGVLIVDKNYRFLITYDNIVFEYIGSHTSQIVPNVYDRQVYESDLPKTFTEAHKVKTLPNEAMTIRCVSDSTFISFACSHNKMSTSNITEFTSTAIVSENAPIGSYKNIVFLNTSYNTSGNITFITRVLETKVVIKTVNTTVDKNVENLTAEELSDFFEKLEEVSARRINELEAANRTRTVIKEKNTTIPFVANADEIALKMANFFYAQYEDSFISLSNTVAEMSKQIEQADKANDALKEELNATKEQIINPDIVYTQGINDYKATLDKSSYVVQKMKLYKWTGLILGCIVLPIVGFIVYKKSWGGL